MEPISTPRIGCPAPSFTTLGTNGQMRFPEDCKGSWVMLYLYIGDFMPCCATDVLALSDIAPRLKAYNTRVLALSPDSVATHIAWLFSLRNLNRGNDIAVELLSDRNLAVANSYGVHTVADQMDTAEKAVVILDPDGRVMELQTFPYALGINPTEFEREILALQTARCQFAVTPSGWTPGADVLEYPPMTMATAGINIAEKSASGCRCVDWYLCYRQDSGERKLSPTIHREE